MNRFSDESELSSFQRSVGEWGEETFNLKRKISKISKQTHKHSCNVGIVNHLKKEVIELSNAKHTLKAPQEAADCFLLLLQFAHLNGFDLLDEARDKMVTNRKRKWGLPDEFGVIEHIE